MDDYFFEIIPLRAKPKKDESLTSLLIRLGERNRIRSITALSELLFPGRHPEVIQKCMDYPPLGIDKLSKVTNIPEAQIFGTTFYYLALNFGLPNNSSRISRFLSESISKGLRFCPQCLVEDPFYRLSWRFNHIIACHKHGCLLLERCSNCNQEIPLFVMPPQMAICPTCGIQLGKLRSKDCLLPSDTVANAYLALSTILAPINNWDEYEQSNLGKLIGLRLRAHRQNLKISREKVMQHLAIGSKHLSSFERGSRNKSHGNFARYFRYMDLMNLTLFDLLTSPPEIQSKSTTLGIKKVDQPKTINKEDYYVRLVTEAMEHLSHSKRRVSIRAAAKLIGVSGSTLCRYRKVRELSPYLQSNEIKYRSKLTAQISQMEAAFDELCKQGKSPGNDDVAESVGFCVEQDPNLREWLRNKKLNTHFDVENPILEKIDAVISGLIRQGKSPTHDSICKEFGISKRTLWDKCPQVRHKLRVVKLQLRKQPPREEDLISQIMIIRAKMREEGIRESQAEIARRIGRSISNLRKYLGVRRIFCGIPRN